MPLTKEYKRLTPRILEHIIHKWGGQLSREDSWNVADSKIYLLLNMLLKDMYRKQYQRNRANKLNNQNEQKIIRKRRGS